MKEKRKVADELFQNYSGTDAPLILKDLEKINRLLGGFQATRSAFRRLQPPQRFTVVDVGAASSGNNQAIRVGWPGASVISLDILHAHLKLTEGARIVADAFSLPFRPQSVDYVYSSLFLHHFTDDQIIALLNGFAKIARRGVVMVDIERNSLARMFLPATQWLFGWHPVTIHDGKLSVSAGFSPIELRGLAARAGLAGAQVRRHTPWFRLSLTWGR